MEIPSRRCSRCRQTKPEFEFGHGQRYCRDCKRESVAAWRTRHPERARELWLETERRRREDAERRAERRDYQRDYYQRVTKAKRRARASAE